MKKLFCIALLLVAFKNFSQRPQGQRPDPIRITGTVIDQETGIPLNTQPWSFKVSEIQKGSPVASPMSTGNTM